MRIVLFILFIDLHQLNALNEGPRNEVPSIQMLCLFPLEYDKSCLLNITEE